MNIQQFKKKPILGILRGIEASVIEPLIETAVSAGLETIEITMNTRGAATLIAKAVACGGKRLMVGAGTVLSVKSLEIAMDAGTTFIVTPVMIEDVMKYCVKNKIPVFPGALTPHEIYSAWNAGATMVKVFPSGVFGPDFFYEIKGPFDNIELLACGGVTPENAKDYFSKGAGAIAFGSEVFRREWIEKKDFASIGQMIGKYISSLKH